MYYKSHQYFIGLHLQSWKKYYNLVQDFFRVLDLAFGCSVRVPQSFMMVFRYLATLTLTLKESLYVSRHNYDNLLSYQFNSPSLWSSDPAHSSARLKVIQ